MIVWNVQLVLTALTVLEKTSATRSTVASSQTKQRVDVGRCAICEDPPGGRAARCDDLMYLVNVEATLKMALNIHKKADITRREEPDAAPLATPEPHFSVHEHRFTSVMRTWTGRICGTLLLASYFAPIS